ncbi:MAG: RNA-binding transcriptional accessory protein [Oscillospiraceae bacterium]|nr:RNA-binding transcriptional accessory protein [Oscillospiraceae bacterium]
MSYAAIIAEEFSVREEYVNNIIALLDEGNTIPFIARYRKEMHGTMDDQLIRQIADKLEYLRNLDARREEVRSLIDAQGNLTEEIGAALDAAATLAEIDDIYRPFRPKRKTRASVAREKGLEPLAEAIMQSQQTAEDPETMAAEYVDAEKGVEDVAAAIAGAQDIIAENVSDDAEVRKRVRNLVRFHGIVTSSAAKEEEEEESVYATYYQFSQPVEKLVGHRVLALNRGEKEGFLKVSVDTDPTRPLNSIRSLYVQGTSACAAVVQAACEDAYTRLIYPSIEREIRAELTEAAAEDAIKLFGVNLRQLLMAPPVKGKIAIGLDPGYRTGCKLAVVDPTGKVLDTSVIYPTHGAAQESRSAEILKDKIKRWGVEVIAIGNGTASKETELFCAKVLREIPEKVAYMVVSEAGASVYSASKLAAEEMPDFDLTLRSAVSIARRLQDPLAELVKIEPKAIGVGQYQHDMPQKRLEGALDGVVEDCVNSVGADVNTASAALLSHISGLTSTVCKNIVAYREENGSFTSRSELKKVPKLGAKAFEQCAGFLRVPGSANFLDNTGVHPESYKAAEGLLKHFGIDKKDFAKAGALLSEKATEESLSALAEELGIGVPTLQDILRELAKPGRDPRDELPPPLLREDVLDMKDLKEGMILQGTVRNVIDFGAFVDIGVHQDGLVHISQISEKFIRHPSDVLKVGDVVKVKILGVDLAKKRISLTMKEA